MKLFINAGIWTLNRWHLSNLKIKSLKATKNKDQRVRVTFRNFLGNDDKNFGKISIILPEECKEEIDEKKDILIEDVKLIKKGTNYEFVKSETSSEEENYIYALLYSEKVCFDDVHIEAKMKDKVKLIQKIRCINDESDAGGYISNIYLVKIHLNKSEFIAFYLTYERPMHLERKLVFYNKSNTSSIPEKKSEIIVIEEEINISVNDRNRYEYISLSDICS